jgi:peptidoglycan-associated lipoprotein
MIRTVRLSAAVLLAAVLIVGACGKKKPVVPPAAPTPPPAAEKTTPAPPPPPTPAPPAPAAPVLTEDEIFEKMTLDELNKKGVLGDVFFAYDSIEINSDGRATLQKNLEFLKRRASTKVMVEGHADSRGTNEYNLALGDRRATAVRSIGELGLDGSRVTVVARGRAAAVRRQNESCWQKNRRERSSSPRNRRESQATEKHRKHRFILCSSVFFCGLLHSSVACLQQPTTVIPPQCARPRPRIRRGHDRPSGDDEAGARIDRPRGLIVRS